MGTQYFPNVLMKLQIDPLNLLNALPRVYDMNFTYIIYNVSKYGSD